jgi:hypothetical protein
MITDPNPRDRHEAILYVRAVAESYEAQPCRYGHFNCALIEGGRCSDEVAGQYNLTDEDV